MATGPEMLEAVIQVRREIRNGGVLAINIEDKLDLGKLTTRHLTNVDFDVESAEKISTALREGDVDPLARSLGIRIVVDPDAPCLLPASS